MLDFNSWKITVELEASAGGIDKETLINTVREEISERNDIIRRKHNLVVFNINELSIEFQNDRAVHDKTAVLDFFNVDEYIHQLVMRSRKRNEHSTDTDMFQLEEI